eukprot:8037029-Pyramimonas_sp.AAC.1
MIEAGGRPGRLGGVSGVSWAVSGDEPNPELQVLDRSQIQNLGRRRHGQATSRGRDAELAEAWSQSVEAG